MPSKPVLTCLLMAFLAGACASSSHAGREDPPAPPPQVLVQSPIALLLEHHDELMLTTDQMIALGQREEALQKQNAALRQKVQDARPVPPPVRPASDIPTPTGSPNGWDGSRPGWGGMSRTPLPASQPLPPPETDTALAQRRKEAEDAMREMEANETAAYADVEKVLDEKQLPKARELVTQQREAREKLREALRAPATPHKS